MSDDWDVDSYKSEFENEEHWQLRRSFMLAHKDKFPEDELVCLAQAFTNVEFMGCRYPDETMVRIAELAKGVVEKFREQRKNCLKRTFVAASEAASAKAKGQIRKQEEPVSTNNITKIEQIEEKPKRTKKKKKKKKSKKNLPVVTISNSRDPQEGDVKSIQTGQDQQFELCRLTNSDQKTDIVNSANRGNSVVKSKSPFEDFVLVMDRVNEPPVTLIQKSCAMSKCSIRWNFEGNSPCECTLFVNDHCIATSVGENMKKSKEQTASLAIDKLRESCYCIKKKRKFVSDKTVTPAQLQSGSGPPSNELLELGEDNIGIKLMKLMGWKGGGLGSHEQGIKDPITAVMPVRRSGLGLSSNNSNMAEFRKKGTDFIKKWMSSDSYKDLVFSSDFNLEERKMLHSIAKTLSLRSRSYGRNPDKQLVVTRKHKPLELVEELLRMGGSSEKYELLYPTKT